MDIKPLGDARAHYWKMIGMADAVGVSLVKAWDEGRLSAADHAGMVERCRGCAGVAACTKLLDGRPDLKVAPDYCVNRDVFVELQAGE